MLFALKLLLTPVLIVGASLAGRRWGGVVSGWIVGLPLTSGPVSVFVALQHGRGFAAHAAAGSFAGMVAETACFLAWAALVRFGLAPAIVGGSLAFAAVAVPARLAWPLVPLAVVAVGCVAGALRLLPQPEAPPPRRPPRWDLPARAVVATALVVGLTEASGALGARLTGLLGVYPLYSIVLAAFAGSAAASLAVLRGVLLGLFAFTAFFLVVGLLLTHVSLAVGYVCAAGVALAVQLVSARALPKPPPPGVSMRTTSPAES